MTKNLLLHNNAINGGQIASRDNNLDVNSYVYLIDRLTLETSPPSLDELNAMNQLDEQKVLLLYVIKDL